MSSALASLPGGSGVDVAGLPEYRWSPDAAAVPPEDLLVLPDVELDALDTFNDAAAKVRAGRWCSTATAASATGL
jgi:hypothetical protein